jgi:phosphoribosylformimino-5-aminoimidazole carboxamide ribotide isomerase
MARRVSLKSPDNKILRLCESEVVPNMDVMPAIDLRDGKCVRLIQGQYHRQITYEDDPVKQAQKFVQAGSKWLHIVDLDGARVGSLVNAETIQKIIQSVELNIQVGGGIRDEECIKQVLDMGITRAIIGTSAISRFGWFAEMTHKFPQKLALSLDARGSKLMTNGWMKEDQQKLWDFATQSANLPLSAIVYTDVTKDGMMSGPNFERTQALVEAVDVPIIAAGGVTQVDDVVKLKELGVAGAIIGRALYEKSIDLVEALEAARDTAQ